MYPNEEVLQSEDCPGLIDTHCHLDLEPLYLRLEEVITAAQQAGVSHFVVPGVHPDGWERIGRIAGDHRSVLPAYGVHPMHADSLSDTVLSRLSGLSSSAVAVGEIGLDPSYSVPLECQERAFREQLRLAVAQGLPVLIHCRHSFQRTLRILQEEGACRVGGIMHAFSGSAEMAREFIKVGFAISLSGMMTRDNSARLTRLVSAIPLQEFVLETDAPDLTPQRYRGQANQPAFLGEMLHALARIKGVDAREAASACRNRSLRVLCRVNLR